jgi:hypothetical protein
LIADNVGSYQGGGIYSAYHLTVSNSTISGNVAHGNGGGISSDSGSTGNTLDVANSTITGNSATGTGGGAAVNGDQFVSFRYSTIVSNTADSTGYGGIMGGGIANRGLVPFTVKNTIIAGNVNGNVAPVADDTFGSIALQYSLLGTNSGASITDNGNNLIGTGVPIDPHLGPLANNGGPTPTRALLPGSLAVNAGNPTAVAGANGVPQYDQRGTLWSRVIGGRIDIGALESQANPLPGDYNFNGVVDAADYVVWRKTSGATIDLRADGNTNGIIDQGDYNLWRSHFGQVLAVGSAAEVTGTSLGSMSSALNSDMSSTVVTTSEATSDSPLAVMPSYMRPIGRHANSLNTCANAVTLESPSGSANDDALLAYLDSLEKLPHASRAKCDARPRAAGTQSSMIDGLTSLPTSRLRVRLAISAARPKTASIHLYIIW